MEEYLWKNTSLNYKNLQVFSIRAKAYMTDLLKEELFKDQKVKERFRSMMSSKLSWILGTGIITYRKSLHREKVAKETTNSIIKRGNLRRTFMLINKFKISLLEKNQFNNFLNTWVTSRMIIHMGSLYWWCRSQWKKRKAYFIREQMKMKTQWNKQWQQYQNLRSMSNK